MTFLNCAIFAKAPPFGDDMANYGNMYVWLSAELFRGAPAV